MRQEDKNEYAHMGPRDLPGGPDRFSCTRAQQPLHLPGGQNLDRPRSSVFIGSIQVFVFVVEGGKVVGIKQASD
jgi:hypothetical protein